MKRLLIMLMAFLALSVGLATDSQARSMSQGGFAVYDTSKLIGATVRSWGGVRLGEIFDIVVDSHGHVDFAVVSIPGFEEFPGKLVAVPFSSLKISQEDSERTLVVLDADKEKFYEAPSWGDNELSNRQQAAALDRYFGVQPYWSKEGAPAK